MRPIGFTLQIFFIKYGHPDPPYANTITSFFKLQLLKRM